MTENPRTICVVTGSRAEYGLLNPTLMAIREHPQLSLKLVATGTHLSNYHGFTIEEIISDGFTIDSEVEMILTTDTPSAIAKSFALAVTGFADIFKTIKPAILLLLGDRYEVLAAAYAAMFARIPIAHMHGGELTLGSMDDSIRHSLTKLSHLHFVATDQYRQRVIQLGENPCSVWNVGACCVERINKLQYLSCGELSEKYNFDFSHPFFLFTYHAETLFNTTSNDIMNSMFQVIADFRDFNIIVTGTNADVGGDLIGRITHDFCSGNADRVLYRESLGQLDYLSAMRLSSLVIGNSSSGVIEAPILNIPSINIGDRQKGRFHPPSVINTPLNMSSIASAINFGLSSPFRNELSLVSHPFGNGTTSQKVVDVLSSCDLNKLLYKEFYDLKL